MRTGAGVRIAVDRLAAGGRGVGRVGGRVVFVAGAFPGDVVLARVQRVHDRYVEARVETVETAAPGRREPPCPLQPVCGGCPWMPIDEAAQRAAKVAILEDALKRIGKFRDVVIDGCESSPRSLGYRSRVEFTLGRDISGRRVLGLHRSEDAAALVDVDRCLLLDDAANAVFAMCREHFLDGPGLGDPGRDGPDAPRVVVRSSAATGEVLVVLRGGPGDFPSAAALAGVLEGRVAGVVRVAAPPGRRGGAQVETISGRSYLEEDLGGVRFRVPAAGFFQVNPAAAAILLARVVEAAGSPAGVVDVYGGVGVFGLALARSGARAAIVEADREAIECGREAAARHGIEDVRFVQGDALAGIAALNGRDRRPELVIADPPRAGLGRGVAAAIAGLTAARIVLVGCDSATFARDAAALAELGYQLASVQAIDLFPQTDHVEAVGVLDRV